MIKKLSIIIPVFNEAQTIARVLQKVSEQNFGGWAKEIIVVDDGSKDNSKTKIENCKSKIENLQLIVHSYNKGKGAAIKTGLFHATGNAVIIQDADLEYDPADIKILLAEMERSDALAIFGSRELQPERRGYWHDVLGVRFLTWLVNLFFGAKLTDVYTCYKLIETELFKNLNIKSCGFEMEMEITAKILKKRLLIKEVPINYYPRKFSEGKKIRAIDGLKGIWTLIKYRTKN